MTWEPMDLDVRTGPGGLPVRARSRSPRVDWLAVLKGAMATLVALPVLSRVGLPAFLAFVVGCAVIAYEKRNHARGRRDDPRTVAVVLCGLAVLGVLTLLVTTGAIPLS